MMKKRLFQWCIVLLLALTACTAQTHSTPQSSAILLPQPTPSKVSTEAAFMLTKLFAITAQAETQISGYPNDATAIAILATKFALNTESALTETALPTETPTPLVPPQTPPCRPSGLKATPYGSMGGVGIIFISGGVVNISASACYLQAWPVFSLVDTAGKTLDIQSEQGDEGSGNILLSPGQLAWINFAWGNWCEPEVAGGVFIRLTLPGQSGSIDIPPGGLNSPIYAGGHCVDPGSKSFVFSIRNFDIETNQPTPSTTTISTPEATYGAESSITIIGTVMDISLSALIIDLKEPVNGFSVVAITEKSMLISTDRSQITLRDIQPGMIVQVTGHPGGSGALLASEVLVLDATPTPPSKYGFSFSLSASWKGYSIITDTWQGWPFNGQSEVTIEQGLMISIRHPQWTSENPRQDIPIMVFTLAQWNSLQQGNYSVSAGGITTELGHNAKYVFAPPPALQCR